MSFYSHAWKFDFQWSVTDSDSRVDLFSKTFYLVFTAGVGNIDTQTALAVQSLLDSQTAAEAPPGQYILNVVVKLKGFSAGP